MDRQFQALIEDMKRTLFKHGAENTLKALGLAFRYAGGGKPFMRIAMKLDSAEDSYKNRFKGEEYIGT